MNYTNPMKVIISGSEGFICRALSHILQKRGVEVIGIDRKSCRDEGEYFRNHVLSGGEYVYHLAALTLVFNEKKSGN